MVMFNKRYRCFKSTQLKQRGQKFVNEKEREVRLTVWWEPYKKRSEEIMSKKKKQYLKEHNGVKMFTKE